MTVEQPNGDEVTPEVTGAGLPDTDSGVAETSPQANELDLDVEAADVDQQLLQARQDAAERLEDLQRLNAEYVNYRKRVERDRLVARDVTVANIAEALIPVLDDIELARQHGDLTEGIPFTAVSNKLEEALAKFGIERYGQVGEEFDPAVHEALLHSESDEVSGPTVTQVLQPGYRAGERIVRAARVAVTDKP